MQKLVKICIICLLGIVVASCGFTTQGDFFREVVKQKGKKIAGQTLENSVWYLCRGSPIGAVKDRFGVSDEKILAYNNICKTDFPTGDNNIIESPELIEEEVPQDLIL